MILFTPQLEEALSLGWLDPRNPLILALAIPVLGLSVNVVCQILALRICGGRGFLRSIVIGFGLGGLATLLAQGLLHHFWFSAPPANSSFLHSFAECLLLIAPAYAGLGYGYANFANLGNASIRIRLYEDLQRAPNGLQIAEIHQMYDEKAILRSRLHRLSEGGDLREKNGRWTVARNRFVIVGGIIFAAKRWIIGRRSEFETQREK
jgi:hypothetical protein